VLINKFLPMLARNKKSLGLYLFTYLKLVIMPNEVLGEVAWFGLISSKSSYGLM